ncbi:hypothetical protein NE865_11195 [Phthorimaea operculella]|nr:hypothetical protein NE865_11195 [Phthorimaea operculella]
MLQKILKECHVDGRGNRGMYIDRNKYICAAGKPTAQGDYDIRSNLQQYQLEDEVNALLSDAIIPPPPPRKLAPLRHPIEPDQRHAGVNNEVKNIINPPKLTQFQDLVSELKGTVYKSYWKTPLGEVPDPRPMLPKDIDIESTTFGKKNPHGETLYDLIMPKNPLPDQTPTSKKPSAHTYRNYCQPAFNPDLRYGHKPKVGRRDCQTKTVLTDTKIIEGTGSRCIVSVLAADFKNLTQPTIGKALRPNNNINNVPEGHRFGKVERKPIHENENLCLFNPKLQDFRKRLAHLNTLRGTNSRRFEPSFFKNFHLILKHEDKDKTGWIPKQIVYNHCEKNCINFDRSLIEGLLRAWEAFDGSNIEYKTFIQAINHTTPMRDFPKLPELYPDCGDYCTTYREAYNIEKTRENDDGPRAGVPSGRYFDLDYPVTPNNYCKAGITCLPDESDMKSCLFPSIFTLMNVNHRDMYASREPEVVRRVFEAAGEEFTDEKFNKVWQEAKKHHSKGLVCYETFRKALKQFDAVN